MRASLLVAVAALAVFAATLPGSFHFDDYTLFSNPAVVSPDGWQQAADPHQTRPLTYLTFWINYQAAGANPAAWHVPDLLLHALTAALLLELLRRWLPGRPVPALAGALLFAVHPIQTEAVEYVFARATLLCTALCVASLLAWTSGRRWLAAALFAAALLAKEECAALPLVLLAIWWTKPDRTRRELAPIAAMLVLSAAAGLRVIAAAGTIAGSGAGAGSNVTPFEYLSMQGIAILRYFRLVALPWGFTVDTDLPTAIWIRTGEWILIAAAAAIAWRHRSLHQAGFWFLAGCLLLIPTSSIFPADDLAADRRMYLPMIAFSAAAGIAAERRNKALIGTALLVLMAISVRYALIWRTERSLWSEAVERSPGKTRPRIQLSRAITPQEAAAILEDAERIAPGDPRVASEQGRLWLELGRPADALGAFGRALALAPGDAAALNNRGVALMALGQAPAARRDFERALERNPCLFDARINLKRLGVIAPEMRDCRFTPDQIQQLRAR